MPKVIYRIQDKNNKGPYRGISQYKWVDRNHYDEPIIHDSHNGRPEPTKEGIRESDLRTYHLFGFKSLGMLMNWFTKTELLRLIIDHGFNVYKITVDDYDFDLPHQTIFSKDLILTQEIFDMDAYI